MVKNGLESSIDPAVRRRDSLIATATVAPTPSSDPLPQTSSATSEPVAETPAPTPSTPQTRSETVAQKVLSGASFGSSSSSSTKAEPSQFAAAVSGGAGVSGNPIYVTLAECEV